MRFVHLAPASRASGIRIAGLQGRRTDVHLEAGCSVLPRAIYAMPASRGARSLRWLSERERAHGDRMVAVIFRMRADEPVYAGCDGRPHRRMTAAEAARWVRRHRRGGAEIVIPRSVTPADLVDVRDPGSG